MNLWRGQAACRGSWLCPADSSPWPAGVCIAWDPLQAVHEFRDLVPDGRISLAIRVSPFYLPLTDNPEDAVSGGRLQLAGAEGGRACAWPAPVAVQGHPRATSAAPGANFQAVMALERPGPFNCMLSPRGSALEGVCLQSCPAIACEV